MQDQLHALVLGMMDEAHSHPVVQDEIWLSDWGRRIAEFIPGMGDMIRITPGRPILVDTPPEQMGEAELRAHAEEEAEHLAAMAKEEEGRQAELDRLQKEEDEMLKRQAALFQAWEDWEVYRHMHGSGTPQPPRTRKRCVIEVEMASGSADGPRRTQIVAVPDDGAVTLRVRAAMVEEIDDSDVATVVLDPPRPVSPEVRFPEPDFDDFQGLYRRWERGELTTPQVEETYGPHVLEMMQTLAEMDAEQEGHGGQGVTGVHAGQHIMNTALDEVGVEGGGGSTTAHAAGREGHEGAPGGAAGSEPQELRFPDLDFPDFQVEYQRWERGEITSPQVAEMHGPQVLEMMQAQYIALAEMDAEQAGQGAAHAERNHGGDRLVEETALDEAAPDGEESVMVIPGDATEGSGNAEGHGQRDEGLAESGMASADGQQQRDEGSVGREMALGKK